VTTDKDAFMSALQASRADDKDLSDAVVVGYAAVTEWLAPDGKRWLTMDTSDRAGEELMRWQVQGYFHNVLHDPTWQPDDDED
jgi:hypothetical protein